jgi:hypothetical protein
MSHNLSSLRVLGKSLHLLAAGWTVSAAWLWLAELRQHVRRHDVLPPDYAVATIITGTVAALILEAIAVVFVRWTGSATLRTVERREWHHAFWWSVYPNVMLFYAVYLMVFGVG